MRIVTGYRAEAHITSNDDQGRNQGVTGTGRYLFQVGNRMEAQLTSATIVTIRDGEALMKGVHFRIAPGEDETITIPAAGSGNHYMGYVVARYTKTATTGIENVVLTLLRGTEVPVATELIAPTIQDGDILGGSGNITCDMILGVVRVNSSGARTLESGEGMSGGYNIAPAAEDVRETLAGYQTVLGRLGAMTTYEEETLQLAADSSVITTTQAILKMYRIGNLAIVCWNIIGQLKKSGEQTLANIDPERAPIGNVFHDFVTAEGNRYLITVRTNGTINIQNTSDELPTAAQRMRGQIVFLIGDSPYWPVPEQESETSPIS